MSDWHTKTREQVLAALGVSASSGLSQKEAQRRIQQFGPNRLAESKREPLWARFLGQMRDPMILVLLAAAVLSLLSTGGEDWVESVIILGIVVVNACISISQEDNAQRALEALQKMTASRAKVLRDGSLSHLETQYLVPGDIILLEAGDLVPADARILECSHLKADESALTGESLPVSKDPAADGLPPDTPLGDRCNMVISSSVITNGRARCVITATGMDTEVGRIAALLNAQESVSTPLQKKMAEISSTLSFLCLSVCAVMFGIGLLYHRPILDMFLTAVSLAVAAIPEGLPAIVTIVLALGVQQMAKRNAIVKKLPAVETLGCAGVICSDKTGTLTRNRMTVQQVWTPSGGDPAQVLTAGALCSDAVLSGSTAASPEDASPSSLFTASIRSGSTRRRSNSNSSNSSRPSSRSAAWTATGDPTEAAIVEAAALAGLRKDLLEQKYPRTGDLPFDADRKLMSTVHLWEGKHRVLVKGAPDILLSRCTHIQTQSGPVPLTPGLRQLAENANADMASRALRVLGCAQKDLSAPPASLTSASLESGLTFLGLVGMIDPPRDEVRDAVSKCFAAGIRPVMITGDHRLTATAIAKELRILREGDLVISGEELDFMPQELLEHDIARFSVFARVTPEHKMRIVQAWQKKGQVVAMTGDGVNDAPALKAADIGCAMGISGTDVAKGAADMILTDDNFATIVYAVEQGRGIYSNIRKAVHYLLSCNIGEILTLFLATLLNFRQAPLAAVQLLWLNLVTDSLPALALGMEPVESTVMQEKPRSAHEPLFTKAFSFRLAWQGALVAALTLAAYWLGETFLPGCGDGAANTMAFATLTFSQLFHAFDVRSEEESLWKIGIFSNSAMNKAFLAGTALQLAVLLCPPLQMVFHVVSLTGPQWLAVLGLSMAPVVVCEAAKAIRRWFRR